MRADVRGVIWGEGGHSGGSFGVRADDRGVIWDEGRRSGGSFGVRVDIQGGHLGCPWTYRGVIWVSMDIRGGGHLGCPWTYRGLSGLSRGRGRRPHQWPEGPQPSAGTRNKRAKRAVFLVFNIFEGHNTTSVT